MTDTRQTTSTSTTPTSRTEENEHRCERKLRSVLRLNAANCVVSGTALAFAAGPIDDLLDTGRPGWVRLVGIALLPFAALCVWVSAGPLQRLHKATPLIIAGDVNWVIASVVTVLLGWYSGGGIVAVLALAVAVDMFAVLQFVGWRQLRTAL